MRVMGLLNVNGTGKCNRQPTSTLLLPPTIPRLQRQKSSLAISWRSIHRASATLYPRILALSTNDIKVGTNIEVDGAPWRVIEFLHVKPGKGAAFVRTKLRNYVSGNTVEKTFRAGASVDEPNLVKEVKQYTYKDGEQFVFMDMTTYEESRLSESELGNKKIWLKEGMECSVLSWNGRIIDVEFRTTVKYKVVKAEYGLKGDTAQGGSKSVTLETGAVVNVPLFVNLGDELLVDTRTGTYISRA